MDPLEFAALERLARSRGSSVAELIREAARAQYLDTVDLATELGRRRSFSVFQMLRCRTGTY
jgi:hypothetical protein